MGELTSVELSVLEGMHRVYLRIGEAPSRDEIFREMNRSTIMKQQNLTNRLTSLIIKNKIVELAGKKFGFTDEGIATLEEMERVVPARVRIVGQTKAGPSGQGDLVIDEYTGPENTYSLMIPEIREGKAVYGYVVIGGSMEEEKIYEGDYVIVEQCGINEIQNGDLIVTRYLPEQYLDADEEVLNEAIGDLTEYSDPTVKYCYISRDPKGRTYNYNGEIRERLVYQLRQRKVKRVKGRVVDDEKFILTNFIEPIGKVVLKISPIGDRGLTSRRS